MRRFKCYGGFPNLDVPWRRDGSLEESDNLPDHALAHEIVEDSKTSVNSSGVE
jgi:hypothetical protein